MDLPSQTSHDHDFHDWEHSQGPEFNPDEPPPPYSSVPDPGLVQNQASDALRQSVRMPKPCVVPRTFQTSICTPRPHLHQLTDRKKLPIPSMEASTVPSRVPTRPTFFPMESHVRTSSPSSMPSTKSGSQTRISKPSV